MVVWSAARGMRETVMFRVVGRERAPALREARRVRVGMCMIVCVL